MPGLDALHNLYGIRRFQEGGTTNDPIAGLYDAVFDRAPDPGGYEYWSNALSSGMSLADIESAFRSSPEAQANIGADTGYTGGSSSADNIAGNANYGFTADTGTGADTGISDFGMGTSQTPQYTGGLEKWYEDSLGRKADQPGLQYWTSQFGETLDPNEILQLQQSPEYQNRQFVSNLYETELGRKPGQDTGFNYWLDALNKGTSREDIESAIASSPEATVFQSYKDILGRAPDVPGQEYWFNQLQKGLTPEQMAAEIAKSQESLGLRAAELSRLFTTQLGTPFVDALTQEEMNKFTNIFADINAKQQYTAPVSQSEFDSQFYLQNNPDVARAGLDPYQHYLEYGFREGRAPNAVGPGTMDVGQRYEEVLRQAALDPELGSVMKSKDPMLYYSLIPLVSDPNQQRTTERIRYGDKGFTTVDGVEIPNLSAKVAESFFGGANSGTMQDFSHGFGNYTRDLGWTSNSASNMIAKGADALGVTKYTSDVYGNQYTGLNEAANILKIDPNQFQGKFVESQIIDEFGNPQTVQKYISAEDQLYDAIGEASKDIYRFTMDSLTPGKAVEGGPQSFNTVYYQKAGEYLIPISKPVEHGGMQNAAVYRPKDFGFAYYAQGPVFVGTAALSMALGDPTGNLAGTIGSFVTGAGATATSSVIAGNIVAGSAIGALGAAATERDIGKGALTGGITGAIAASTPYVLNSIPGMDSIISSISSGLNVDPSTVGNIVNSTLSRTLATAAAGANGEQILKSFTTALASTSIGAAAANGIEKVMEGTFTPEQIAGMARATQLVTNAAATAAMSGGNAQQVLGSVINSLVQGGGSINQAIESAKVDQATTPFGTENVGLTTGAVDAVLQEPIFRQDILDNASDPIAAMNAMNNWTGNPRENMQYLANDLLNQGMPKQDIINSFQSVFRMDEPAATAFVAQEVARSAITELANKSADPIATFNAATLATGDKKQNVDLVVNEMVNQGLSKTQISKNLQDIFQVPADKADTYATQITKDQPFTTKATTFGEAFREAREAGVKEFEYDGKRFNTNLAPTKVGQIDRKEAETGTLPQGEGRTPSWSGLIKSTAPVPGLKSAVDQPMESTPFGPMTTSKAPSFMGQAAETAAKAATQQQITNYLSSNTPAQIAEDKGVLSSIADYYKDSIMGTVGGYIKAIGEFKNSLGQVAVASKFIEPDNSFIVSSKAMSQVGSSLVPDSIKQEQKDIFNDIKSADSFIGKVGSGIISGVQNFRGAGLFAGEAVVQTTGSLAAGAAVTALTANPLLGLGTAVSVQSAQSFGTVFDDVSSTLMREKNLTFEQAREAAIIPAFVAATATAVTSAVSVAPVLGAITGPAASAATNVGVKMLAGPTTAGMGTNVAIRSITGEGAERIIQSAIPVFTNVMGPAARQFVPEFFESVFHGMTTEYATNGTITFDKHIDQGVLEGLTGMAAAGIIAGPFGLADMIPAERTAADTFGTVRPEETPLKEYVVPQLEYKPSVEVKFLGFTPNPGPTDATQTVIDTRDTSATQIAEQFDIDIDTATKIANDGIGATAIDAINKNSSDPSSKINPGDVIVEDAFGNPITYATAVGAILTDSPIIDLQVGTQEQQLTNVQILQSLFDKINIDPEDGLATQLQVQKVETPVRETELAFKERPDIRNLFNIESLFPVETPGEPQLQTPTDLQVQTPTDLQVQTPTDLQVQTPTDLQVQTPTITQLQTPTDLRVQTPTITQVQTPTITQVQTPTITTPVDPNVPVDVPVDINVPVNVPVDVGTPEDKKKKKKKEEKKRRPAYQRALQLIDAESGIYDLGPAFTRARTNYRLAGQFGMASGGKVALPFYDKIAPRYDVFGMARDSNTGGQGVLGGTGIFDPKSPFVGSDIKMPKLTVGKTKPNLNYELAGYPNLARTALQYAEGGSVPEGHNPQFFSEGGLNSLENTYVNGEGDGTSDSVPAMLANGEFVIPADVVSSLGNGSNDAGASVLDEFLKVVREHKQKHDAKKLPPDSKGALAYLLEAKKRA